MSHFYGEIHSNGKKSTRCGHKSTGIMTYAASWEGAIKVDVWHDGDFDHYEVSLVSWPDKLHVQTLAKGKLI